MCRALGLRNKICQWVAKTDPPKNAARKGSCGLCSRLWGTSAWGYTSKPLCLAPQAKHPPTVQSAGIITVSHSIFKKNSPKNITPGKNFFDFGGGSRDRPLPGGEGWSDPTRGGGRTRPLTLCTPCDPGDEKNKLFPWLPSYGACHETRLCGAGTNAHRREGQGWPSPAAGGASGPASGCTAEAARLGQPGVCPPSACGPASNTMYWTHPSGVAHLFQPGCAWCAFRAPTRNKAR